jgi:hypothetical protein
VALDVYAGPLTTYYRRDWENAGQRQAREQGIKYTQIGPDGDVSKYPKPSVEEVLKGVAAWRAGMSNGLADHLKGPLEWNDSPDIPYLTDRPGYAAYGALLLWAAYSERPEVARPERWPEEWFGDPVFMEQTQAESSTRYTHILLPEVWLPCDFEIAFKFPTLTSDDAWIGSSVALLAQLEDLNKATFRATSTEEARWLRGEVEAATEAECDAKVGFAMFRALANHSVAKRVPMLLDA